MPPYDDWNKIDEEEEEELQDTSVGFWSLESCIQAYTWLEDVRREERRDSLLYRLLRLYA